ncbi:MAG TPA: winged helix-turn-helix domain-containing protein [Candidatus Eisenbacteria bacterium]|jgi:Tol biopolymer transport system component/DNA-binding winged helix-turn-helix (wHTH) protein|nr:winged helix-turn-helix domain-containing protein [Candidatus Eisenbacteria bacterium]
MYRFDSFQLDPRSHELRRDGLRIKIPEQCFVVLLTLLERPGQLVTREELRKAVWPSDTFVDFDTGLNKIVKQLRQILGDSADAPSFIETAPKLGYRFIAEINPTRNSSTLRVNAGATRSKSRAAIQSVGLGVLVAALLVGAILFFRRFFRGHSAIPFASSELVPLTGMQGAQDYPAFSPDGNQVAFTVHNADGGTGIYTTLIGGEKPLRLTNMSSRNGNWEDCCPVWSPDGRSIAFNRRSELEHAIYLIPALGGTPKKIYTFNDPEPWVVGETRQTSWSPDGKTLAVSAAPLASSSRAILLISLADFSQHFVTSPGASDSDWSPAFSPDGRFIAFRRTAGPGLVDDLYVMPSSGGEPRRVTSDNVYIPSAPAWTPNSREIIFTSIRGGLTTLWRIPFTGGTPRRIEGIGTSAFSPSIAPKGHRMAFTSAFANQNLWAVKFTDKTHAAGDPQVFLTSKGMNALAHFSADGKRIAFESSRSGYNEIWTANSDGSNPVQLTFLNGDSGTPRWSNDGRHVAFDYRPRGRSEVYIADFSGAPPKLFPTNAGADNFVPSWSHDGKWIYFASTKASERSEVWKIPFPSGGPPIQLTTHGGMAPVESTDGFVYYSRTQGSDEVWRISPRGEEETLVVKGVGLDCWCHLALAPQGIYFISDRTAGNRTLFFYDFKSRERSSIAALGRLAGNPALSPDGKSLIYSQVDLIDETIMLVNNFR